MIERRTLPGVFEVRAEADGEGRTVVGVVVPYDAPARVGHYVERFARGAFTGTQPERVKLLAEHNDRALPIGRAVTLTETADALVGAFHVSQTRAGDDVLALIRDGAVDGLSVGFIPKEDRWSTDRRSVTRVRADLVEVSVCTFPVYDGARIATVRSAIDRVEHRPRLRLARLARP